jgi:hypothetical protein
MKRSELKAIVKECLIEILSEGLQLSSEPALRTEAVTRMPLPQRQPQQNTRRPAYDPRLDEPVGKRVVRNDNVGQAVKQAVSVMTDDPLMASIFADSIKTVQKQNAQGHANGAQPGMSGAPAHADAAAHAMAGARPDQIFEGSDRWASLAFMEGPPRNLPAES